MTAAAEEIRLRSGSCEAGVVPALGAAVTFLSVDGRQILRSGAMDEIRNDPRNAACFACVPYFGRIAGALDFRGRQFPMHPTLPAADSKNALHGEGWLSPWRVIDHDDKTLTCAFTHQPGEAGRFPFPYEARQTISLTDKAAHLSLSVQNTGEAVMPAGLGLHPYFIRTDETCVAFDAPHFWTPPGEDKPGAFSPRPDILGGGAPAPLPKQMRDHSYAGFGGEALIIGADGAVKLTADTPILHMFAPQGEDNFCLEPVSHAPGGFTDLTNHYGGRALAPGETLSISMTLSAQK